MRLLLLGVAALAAWPASGSAPSPPPPARRSRAARPRRGGLGGAGHLARPDHQRVARRRRHLVAPGIRAHPGLAGRADHGARPAVGLDAAAGHREASGPGAILLRLALSLAAQNAVTALRMQAGPPLAPGQPAAASTRPRRSGVVPGALLTITSTPAGSNAGKHAAKRGPGMKLTESRWAGR